MALAAGRLRQRVDILRPTKVKDGSGYSVSWETVALSVPAEVLGQNGREALIEKAFQGVEYYKITLRYRTDIKDSDQLRYGTKDLNIRSAVDPDARRERLVVLADTEAALKTA